MVAAFAGRQGRPSLDEDDVIRPRVTVRLTQKQFAWLSDERERTQAKSEAEVVRGLIDAHLGESRQEEQAKAAVKEAMFEIFPALRAPRLSRKSGAAATPDAEGLVAEELVAEAKAKEEDSFASLMRTMFRDVLAEFHEAISVKINERRRAQLDAVARQLGFHQTSHLLEDLARRAAEDPRAAEAFLFDDLTRDALDEARAQLQAEKQIQSKPSPAKRGRKTDQKAA